uniref:Flap endonuclease 1 n=1 Tax=Globodera pallida TaxID=36090 RepID=A0A183CCC6_GLOPA
MGIKDLSKVIADHCPSAVKINEMKSYFGRRIAIDASMSLYQFLIAVRQDGLQLVSEDGETTSHLNGLFYRTIRMMENGIRPIYVFDGKPPELKANELDKRMERRAEAEKQLQEATERGDKVDMDRFGRRLVKVTNEQIDECKHLLSLMGVPIVEAPSEAESQCAELVRAGKAYATATEDMDALTFGSKILVRHMTFSEAKKMPIKEFSLERALKDMDISYDQFVDFCILLGCDYCASIRGIGPKKAFELIKKHKSIETILEQIDQKKYAPPDNWMYKQARELFLRPNITAGEQFEFAWTEPKVQDVVDYLCGQKGFNEDRIRSALDRLQKARKMAHQGRIDSFFKPQGTVSKAANDDTKQKRKADEEEKKTNKVAVKKTKKKK